MNSDDEQYRQFFGELIRLAISKNLDAEVRLPPARLGRYEIGVHDYGARQVCP